MTGDTRSQADSVVRCGLPSDPLADLTALVSGGEAVPDEEQDDRQYHVVVNAEEQYSIWLADRGLPAGWRAVGKQGTKAECLDYIGTVWTDMRPLSLRERMQP
jgi:MbtH protein